MRCHLLVLTLSNGKHVIHTEVPDGDAGLNLDYLALVPAGP